MKTINLTEILTDYDVHDYRRIEQILDQTFEEKQFFPSSYFGEEGFLVYATTVYERQGLTVTRHISMESETDLGESKVLKDNLILTGNKKDVEEYATNFLKMFNLERKQKKRVITFKGSRLWNG